MEGRLPGERSQKAKSHELKAALRRQMEIMPRPAHVVGNLLAQRFHRGKLDLPAQPVQEKKFNLGLCRQLDGMKVQQVGLDRERLLSEGWAIAGVGDRVEALAIDARARDVHAVPWHQLVVL